MFCARARYIVEPHLIDGTGIGRVSSNSNGIGAAELLANNVCIGHVPTIDAHRSPLAVVEDLDGPTVGVFPTIEETHGTFHN